MIELTETPVAAAQSREAMHRELIGRVLSRTAMPSDPPGQFMTELPSLMLLRMETVTVPKHTLYQPAMCVNLQGSKELLLEDGSVDYDQMQYLMIGVDLPLFGRMRPVPGKPFLGLALSLDLEILRDLVEQVGFSSIGTAKPCRGFVVGDLDETLLECILRIVRLLDTPEAIGVLYPSLARELYYWLLRRPNGMAIAQMALHTGNSRYIVEAIHAIRQDLARPLRVEDLASIAGMSQSSFHAHFKALTSMSPLQYQKRLRLLEARRQMRAQVANATEAAFSVGYNSVSQFSREYARMFGTSPSRDATP